MARLVARGWIRVVLTTDFDRLLEQALAAAGGQLCGWSAQWDHALVSCFERRATRRCPVFWCAPLGPRGRAAELVARHGAVRRAFSAGIGAAARHGPRPALLR